jgi:DNA replication protein DnaC
MSINGRHLARAKDRLSETKHQNELELARRKEKVYARLPEVPELEMQLKRLMTGVIGLALKQGGDVIKAIEGIEKESLSLQARRAELLVEAGYPRRVPGRYIFLQKMPRQRLCQRQNVLLPERALRSGARQGHELSSEPGGRAFRELRPWLLRLRPDPFSGSSQRKLMEFVYNACKAYAATFGKDSDNLLFRGDTGLGKTFLSACIARVVSAKGFSVVYETVVSALEAYEIQKFSRNQDDAETAAARVKKILDCDLLIIDDLGTEMITAFSQSALYTIINQRLLNCKKTIISTNLTDEELNRNYNSQIFSRLFGEYTQYRFYGTDIRTKKRC